MHIRARNNTKSFVLFVLNLLHVGAFYHKSFPYVSELLILTILQLNKELFLIRYTHIVAEVSHHTLPDLALEDGVL